MKKTLPKYTESYYDSLYVQPFFSKFGISKLYYLYLAYFSIITKAHLKKGDRVLDFGCGIGNIVWALRQFGIDAYGFDPSISAKKFSRMPDYCIYQKTATLPYKSHSFDVVFSTEVLEHVPQKSLTAVFTELERVAKYTMIHAICVSDRGKIAFQEPTHITVKSEKWWGTFFKKRGYQVETGNPLYFYPFIQYLFSGMIDVKNVGSGYFFIHTK